MKLTDLDPHFVDHRVEPADSDIGRPLPDGSIQWGGFPQDVLYEQDEFKGADGIEFLCPKCFAENGGEVGTHLIQVFFAGGDAPDTLGHDSEGKTVRWNALGSGFDDLTLTPSIYVKVGCGWHGFVTNGEVTNA